MQTDTAGKGIYKNIVKCEVEIKQFLDKTVGTDDEDFDEKPENVTENNSGFFVVPKFIE